MYEDFYGFKEKPFQIVPNPVFLYKSEKHERALTYLEYGLLENVGFILLSGEIGSGKTMLIHYIMAGLNADTEVALINNTNVSSGQLLAMILNEFELPSKKVDKATALDTLNQFLIQCYAEKRRVLLIIDEAQNLSGEALEEIRMLSNLQSDDQPLLQIMIVGQPELVAKLKRPMLRQFAQRIAVSYHLSGLNREETGKYIAFRLQKAGGQPDLFTPHAEDLIFKISKGIPRSINLACEAALVYGFADEARRISQDIVKKIIKDKIGVGLGDNSDEDDEVDKFRPTTESSEGVLLYLQHMESEMQVLRKQIAFQTSELQQIAAGNKDELVARLNRLLQEERKRNTELMRRYFRLEMKYRALMQFKAKLEDKLAAAPGETKPRKRSGG